VGGRVPQAVRDGFHHGQYAEGGGEFIETRHDRLLNLASEFGLTLEVLGGMSEWGEWLALEGRAGRADDAALWGVDLSAEQKKIEAALAELGRRVPDPAQPQTAPEADTLDRRSALDWLNALDVHPLAKKAFAAHLRSEYAVEPDHYSLLDFARWGAFYYNDPDRDEPVFRIVGATIYCRRRWPAPSRRCGWARKF
jgi:monoamine oxidase